MIAQDDDWENSAQSHNLTYESAQLTPKEMIRLIRLLKQQRQGQLKGRFSFRNEHHQRAFMDTYRRQENEQIQFVYKEQRPQKKTKEVFKGDRKTVSSINFDSYIKTNVFMIVYAEQLQKIKSEQNIQIIENGKEIILTNSKSQLLRDQIMNLYRNLKILFTSDTKLQDKIKYSRELKNHLEKRKIFCYTRPSKSGVAFYSTDLTQQQIRINVNKETAYQLKIFDLMDKELPYKYSAVIFKLLTFSLKSVMEEIRKKYEINLEVNENLCALILHNKHEVFAKAPLQDLEKHLSNLLFISFNLNKSRDFTNRLKKRFEDFKVSRLGRVVFMCINRKKFKSKDQVLSIFHLFLDELRLDSSITIHLIASNSISENSTEIENLLQKASKYCLQVERQQTVKNKECNNMMVRLKDFSQRIRVKKQTQFSNFLMHILMFNQKEKQFTQEQINQSMMIEHKNESARQSLNTSIILNKSLISQREESPKKEVSYSLPYAMISLVKMEGDTLIQKNKKDNALEEFLNDMAKFKAWKLKASENILKLQDGCMKDKGYLSKNVIEGDKINQKPTLIHINHIQQGQEAYLIYKNEEEKLYVPTHLIKRIQ